MSRRRQNRHLIQSSQTIKPSIYAAYSLAAEEGTLKLILEELINKYNTSISYKPPSYRRPKTPISSLSQDSRGEGTLFGTQEVSRCPSTRETDHEASLHK